MIAEGYDSITGVEEGGTEAVLGDLWPAEICDSWKQTAPR